MAKETSKNESIPVAPSGGVSFNRNRVPVAGAGRNRQGSFGFVDLIVPEVSFYGVLAAVSYLIYRFVGVSTVGLFWVIFSLVWYSSVLIPQAIPAKRVCLPLYLPLSLIMAVGLKWFGIVDFVEGLISG